MSVEYKIPFTHEPGKYGFNDLPQNGGTLDITFGEFEILSYFIPDDEYEAEVRIYDSADFPLNEQIINDGLTASYDDSGKLKRIDLANGDKEKLVYIAIEDERQAEEIILANAEKNAELILQRLKDVGEEIAIVFSEYYEDIEGFDIHVKYASKADIQAVLDKKRDTDNGGNYLEENRIDCDTDTLGIILMCLPGDVVYDMMSLLIDTMNERIRDGIEGLPNKADGIKFIVSDYD